MSGPNREGGAGDGARDFQEALTPRGAASSCASTIPFTTTTVWPECFLKGSVSFSFWKVSRGEVKEWDGGGAVDVGRGQHVCDGGGDGPPR